LKLVEAAESKEEITALLDNNKAANPSFNK